MERLTYRNHEQTPFMHYDGVSDETTIRQAIIKLAAYEDAEEQGRIIVTPCKVGDTVYVRADTWGNTWNYKTVLYDKYLVGEILSITKTKKQTLMKIQVEHNVQWKRERRRYTVNAIGITVFLTREAAEAALTANNNSTGG